MFNHVYTVHLTLVNLKTEWQTLDVSIFRERLSKYESVEEPGCPDRNPTPPQMWEERQKSQQPLKVVVGDNNNNKNLGLILVWTSNSFAPRIQEVRFQVVSYMRRPLFVWAKTNKGLLVDWNKEETSLSERGVVTIWRGLTLPKMQHRRYLFK